MAAASAFKPLSTSNGCVTSLAVLSTSKPSYPFVPFPARPIKPFHLASSSLLSFRRSRAPLSPLVAQTSDWARQEEEEEDELQGEGLEWQQQEEGSAEAELLDCEGEGQAQEDDAEGASFVAEGEPGGFAEEEEEESYPEPPEDAKLFVGNLPYDIDSEKLAQLFDKAGIVEVAEVIYNRETDQSRGFGFVTMSTVEEAEKAVETLHRYEYNGRLLTVNKAAPRGSRPTSREYGQKFRIYVGNLPWQVDDGRLEQVFSEYGKVVDARVVYDRESGRSRGFGFVTMATQNELDDAIAALDGQSLDGRAIRVNVAEEGPRRSSF